MIAAAARLRSRWALWVARRSSLLPLAQGPVRRVLVICQGNIYRSPLAASRLRQRIGEAIEIRSAGFHPVAGRRAPEDQLRLAGEFGIDLSSHRSAVVSGDDVAWANGIVIMDRSNWCRLREFREVDRKIMWLGTFGPGPPEIQDPYGHSLAVKRDIAIRILRDSDGLAAHLAVPQQPRNPRQGAASER